jgi:hypothetical protein
MTEPIVSRRHFNHIPLISLLAATALQNGTAAAEQATPHAPTRRDVIKQELPGEPRRDIILIEVTYGHTRKQLEPIQIAECHLGFRGRHERRKIAARTSSISGPVAAGLPPRPLQR